MQTNPTILVLQLIWISTFLLCFALACASPIPLWIKLCLPYETRNEVVNITCLHVLELKLENLHNTKKE